MLDFVREDAEEPAIWRTIEFSEIDIGEKFLTDRWIWEKVDRETARALSELMGRPGVLLGAVSHFQPWSKVQLIERV